MAVSAPRGCGVHPRVRHGSCAGSLGCSLASRAGAGVFWGGGQGQQHHSVLFLERGGVGTHKSSPDGAVPSLCWEGKLPALSIAKAQASLPCSSPSSSSSSPKMKNHDFLALRARAAWEVDSGGCSCVCTVVLRTGPPLTALQVETVLPIIPKCRKCGVWLCCLSFPLCFKAFLPFARKMKLCVVYSRDSRSTGL